MRNFLKEHSYDAVKMFVTQCALSIFGLSLALACGYAQASGMVENETLGLCCSVFAILFYMFLLYTSLWELGSKHHIPVMHGHRPRRPLLGLYIALLANSINFLWAIGFMLDAIFVDVYALMWIGDISRISAILTQGMFAGVLSIEVNFSGELLNLNRLWFMYFLTPIPALIAGTVGYYFGLKNIKIFKFFDAKPAAGPAKRTDHNNDSDRDF